MGGIAMVMRRTFLLLLLATGLAQAGEVDRIFKNLLKGAAAQPTPTPKATTAMATPPQSSPAPTKAPKAGQILGGLLLSFGAEPPQSPEEERNIGRTVAGSLLGAAPLVRDDQLQGYVNRVGRWVALQSERPDLEWRFGVIDTEDINAFAAPGGYVFVTKGLYRKLDNEAQLAGVLAHEIGHVIRKHHLRMMQKSQALADLGAAAGRKLEGSSQIASNFLGNFWEAFARGLDKEAEFEADRIGMVLAARAGYDAYGLPAVLQEIGHVSASDNRVSFLFKTHPHPDVRFEQLAEAVGTRLDDLAPGKEVANRFLRIR